MDVVCEACVYGQGVHAKFCPFAAGQDTLRQQEEELNRRYKFTANGFRTIAPRGTFPVPQTYVKI